MWQARMWACAGYRVKDGSEGVTTCSRRCGGMLFRCLIWHACMGAQATR